LDKNAMSKNIFLILILIPILNFSQSVTSSKVIAKVFISAGTNSTQYYSDTFINYLLDKTGAAKPTYVYSSGDIFPSVSISPKKINYAKPSLGPIISAGMEFNTSRLKKLKLHHIIEAGYLKYKRKYSYLVSYYENMFYGENHRWAHINDTVQSTYTHRALLLGYKLQPTYRFMFLSFGISCSVNLIKNNQQKKEQIDFWGENLDVPGSANKYDSKNSSTNTVSNLHFVNIPIQFGAGGYIKTNKIILKPAFYFTPNFSKKYNFYTLSLGIMYCSKKTVGE
jgi:hypothetical protein